MQDHPDITSHEALRLNFENRFYALGEDYHTATEPTPLEQPGLLSASAAAAALLDIDPAQFGTGAFLDMVAGNRVIDGMQPLAMLYAGHQFGHYVTQLGDGRAILLGQVRNAAGESWDVQLKGAGLTRFSRDGDGRAVLRSSIREYLASEAMHGLGIPTTRALALVGSDEEVYRERIETAAVVTRLAPSFVRFGSFEVFFYRNEFDRLAPLADHVIDEHYPHLSGEPDRYLRWLQEVISRSAALVAHWQAVGFAHGVLNTDNMSVLGLTLDYGPYGFLDSYAPGFICNHSDYHGRYAFDAQPAIVHWNLSCFAQALLPLLADEPQAAAERGRAALDGFKAQFDAYYLRLMRKKLGLLEEKPGDMALAAGLLDAMQGNQVDYTILFRKLADFDSDGDANPVLRDQFLQRDAFDRWATDYRSRLAAEGGPSPARATAMRKANPAIVLRNWIAQEAIEKAEQGDIGLVDELLAMFSDPYRESLDTTRFAAHPPAGAETISVSCSS